jgi:bifunctional DNA-binding transcriptional regulator/antitoxin component of YhaV-PrlF toxin-antitoxin module
MGIKVGDRVVVYRYGNSTPIVVKKVLDLPSESRKAFILDWGEHGTSRVYDHDEGKIWHQLKNIN